MKQILSNDLLSVEISSHGAELQSIKSVKDNHEYLWHGDPKFWDRRSPILFPIVGSVWNAEFRMDGKLYHMGQHGIARDFDFEIMDNVPENEAWFSLKWNEETLKSFPRKFRLEIGYKLEAERLSVMWRVHNDDEKEMPFQIGAHPGFMYPYFEEGERLRGYLSFDKLPQLTQLVEQKGCFGDKTQKIVLDNENMIPIVENTFDIDTIVIANEGIKRVSLLDKYRKPYVSVIFDMPLVGIWSPGPDAPFVCIEPWFGRADNMDFTGEFSERPYVESITPGQTFSTSYMILFENI